MKTKIVVIMIIFIEVQIAQADKIFTSSGEINEGDNWGAVYVQNDTTVVDMWGGFVADLFAEDASKVNIYGGQIVGGGGLWPEKGIAAWYSSTVNIFGGSICVAQVGYSATLNLYGGEIDTIWGNFGTSPVINVYGIGLQLTNDGGLHGDGTISGNWSDGSEFYVDLYGNAYSEIILHEIPEPTSLLLVGFGGTLLLKKYS